MHCLKLIYESLIAENKFLRNLEEAFRKSSTLRSDTKERKNYGPFWISIGIEAAKWKGARARRSNLVLITDGICAFPSDVNIFATGTSDLSSTVSGAENNLACRFESIFPRWNTLIKEFKVILLESDHASKSNFSGWDSFGLFVNSFEMRFYVERALHGKIVPVAISQAPGDMLQKSLDLTRKKSVSNLSERIRPHYDYLNVLNEFSSKFGKLGLSSCSDYVSSDPDFDFGYWDTGPDLIRPVSHLSYQDYIIPLAVYHSNKSLGPDSPDFASTRHSPELPIILYDFAQLMEKLGLFINNVNAFIGNGALESSQLAHSDVTAPTNTLLPDASLWQVLSKDGILLHNHFSLNLTIFYRAFIHSGNHIQSLRRSPSPVFGIKAPNLASDCFLKAHLFFVIRTDALDHLKKILRECNSALRSGNTATTRLENLSVALNNINGGKYPELSRLPQFLHHLQFAQEHWKNLLVMVSEVWNSFKKSANQFTSISPSLYPSIFRIWGHLIGKNFNSKDSTSKFKFDSSILPRSHRFFLKSLYCVKEYDLVIFKREKPKLNIVSNIFSGKSAKKFADFIVDLLNNSMSKFEQKPFGSKWTLIPEKNPSLFLLARIDIMNSREVLWFLNFTKQKASDLFWNLDIWCTGQALENDLKGLTNLIFDIFDGCEGSSIHLQALRRTFTAPSLMTSKSYSFDATRLVSLRQRGVSEKPGNLIPDSSVHQSKDVGDEIFDTLCRLLLLHGFWLLESHSATDTIKSSDLTYVSSQYKSKIKNGHSRITSQRSIHYLESYSGGFGVEVELALLVEPYSNRSKIQIISRAFELESFQEMENIQQNLQANLCEKWIQILKFKLMGISALYEILDQLQKNAFRKRKKPGFNAGSIKLPFQLFHSLLKTASITKKHYLNVPNNVHVNGTEEFARLLFRESMLTDLQSIFINEVRLGKIKSCDSRIFIHAFGEDGGVILIHLPSEKFFRENASHKVGILCFYCNKDLALDVQKMGSDPTSGLSSSTNASFNAINERLRKVFSKLNQLSLMKTSYVSCILGNDLSMNFGLNPVKICQFDAIMDNFIHAVNNLKNYEIFATPFNNLLEKILLRIQKDFYFVENQNLWIYRPSNFRSNISAAEASKEIGSLLFLEFFLAVDTNTAESIANSMLRERKDMHQLERFITSGGNRAEKTLKPASDCYWRFEISGILPNDIIDACKVELSEGYHHSENTKEPIAANNLDMTNANSNVFEHLKKDLTIMVENELFYLYMNICGKGILDSEKLKKIIPNLEETNSHDVCTDSFRTTFISFATTCGKYIDYLRGKFKGLKIDIVNSEYFVLSNSNSDFEELETTAPGASNALESHGEFFLIIHITESIVKVWSFHPTIPSSGSKDLLESIKKIIEACCRKANQYILLHHLNESRHCSNLLLPKQSSDDFDEDDEITMNNSSDSEFPDGFFQCELLKQWEFKLNRRVRPSQATNYLSLNALHPFSVINRRNLFVFAHDNQIYYLRVGEVQKFDDSRDDSYFDLNKSLETLDLSNTDQTKSPQINPPSPGYSKKSGKQESNYLVLNLFGIDQPEWSVFDDFLSMVQNRIDLLTMNLISVFLARNTNLKLTLQDIEFIIPTDSQGDMIKDLNLPTFVQNITILLKFFKQHCSLFINSFSSTEMTEVMKKLYITRYPDDEPFMEDYIANFGDNCLIYNAADSRPSGTGEFFIGQGMVFVQIWVLDATNRPLKESHQKLFYPNISTEEFLNWYRDGSETSASQFKIRCEIWAKGSINVAALVERLTNSFKHSCIDYVTESFLTAFEDQGSVVDPLTESCVAEDIKWKLETVENSLKPIFNLCRNVKDCPTWYHLSFNLCKTYNFLYPEILVELKSCLEDSLSVNGFLDFYAVKGDSWRPFCPRERSRISNTYVKESLLILGLPVDRPKEPETPGRFSGFVSLFRRPSDSLNDADENSIVQNLKTMKLFEDFMLLGPTYGNNTIESSKTFVPKHLLLILHSRAAGNCDLYAYNWTKSAIELINKSISGLELRLHAYLDHLEELIRQRSIHPRENSANLSNLDNLVTIAGSASRSSFSKLFKAIETFDRYDSSDIEYGDSQQENVSRVLSRFYQ